ncbi:hypothetical protein [Streptomyces sp. NPDC096323]|uniref:hypothetical protein n=1 Tax=Streptomyces sp. NPDC096323 TaxID=3155822 RepID=UPI00332C17A3
MTATLGGRAPVAFRPEVAAGLPTPRRPAEIVGGDGHDVLTAGPLSWTTPDAM